MSRGTSGAAQWLYCFECEFIDYPQEDKSSPHNGHKIYKFENALQYIAPIKLVLMKLDTETEITHNELVLFRLAIALHGENPNDWIQK